MREGIREELGKLKGGVKGLRGWKVEMEGMRRKVRKGIKEEKNSLRKELKKLKKELREKEDIYFP